MVIVMQKMKQANELEHDSVKSVIEAGKLHGVIQSRDGPQMTLQKWKRHILC